MALEGTFKDFHIADIVQLIGLQRKTGTLTLEGEEDTLTVTFQDGAVTWAQSARLPWDRRMGQILLAQGRLQPGELQEALAAQQESRKRLCAILEERGLLPKQAWDSILAREVEEVLYRPFRWKAGRYRFVPASVVDLTEGAIGPLGAESVLMEGIRRVDEWPMIREKVPSPTMVFKAGSGAGMGNPRQVETGAASLLGLVNGRRTVQELVDASGLGEFAAMQALASLVEAGAIAPIGPGPTPAPAPAKTRGVPGAAGLSRRLSAGLPPRMARLLWGLAALWLLLALALFRVEPSGLLPLSPSRAAALDRIRSLQAQEELVALAREAERYVASTGEFPSGVEALGLLEGSAADPWGHPYRMRRSGAALRLRSGGPDGRMGTPDDLERVVGDP